MLPFDLHVLGLPPAFNLSHDQTLQFVSQSRYREIVLAAVTKNGWALEYASTEMQADREIVLAAVTKNGAALEYASTEMQADRKIVLAAVTKNGAALKFASAEMQADRKFVLALS